MYSIKLVGQTNSAAPAKLTAALTRARSGVFRVEFRKFLSCCYATGDAKVNSPACGSEKAALSLQRLYSRQHLRASLALTPATNRHANRHMSLHSVVPLATEQSDLDQQV